MTLIAAAAALSISNAETLRFGGPIDGSQSTVADGPGVGNAVLSLDTETGLFDLSINIQGQANEITMSHIHLGATGETGGVIFDIGDASGYDVVGSFYSRMISDAEFPAENLGDLLAGNTYLNFHTAANPSGEVRGQLSPLPSGSDSIANLSTRGLINPGEGVVGSLVAGLILDQPKTVLFRVLGPTLADFGVGNSVPDTSIEVVEIDPIGGADPVLVGANDDWVDGGQAYRIAATGFAPGADNESAVIADLLAGAYTATANSEQGAGVALVETFGITTAGVGATVNRSANSEYSARLTLLNAALQETGLTSILNEPGPFTLFAPTDQAFLNVFTEAELTELLADDADREDDLATLTGVLLFHVVGANIPSSAIPAGATDLTAMSGEIITVVNDNGVTIQGVGLVEVDIPTTNGVIHVIDSVIAPSG